MTRIVKLRSGDEAGWDQALSLYREQLRFYLDYLIQCGCGEDILAKVESEASGSPVPDDFKFRYLLRILVRNVILHMRECDRAPEGSRFLPRHSPDAAPALRAQERIVYFLRDILEYSKRDTSLLIGITDAQADKLLSLARKRIDLTEGPSSMKIEGPDWTCFRWKLTDIELQ